ncbi:MAG: SDR family NAD(P)-dependent oxidoreductase, partial [Lacipirellulaceae bacterium]
MSKRLTEKVAVVTGGGSGIGEAICLRFASEGARVAVLDLDGDAAEQVAAEIVENEGEAQPYPCDVSNLANVEETLARVVEDFGGLTTLVNNAGIAHIGNVEQTGP